MLRAGEEITLQIEKPAAGGRMIARHEGQVVFVSGTLPGEQVRARVEQVKGQLAFAATTAVERASADRRPAAGDPRCGGSLFAHITGPRQLTLKREILADAFARLGHLELPATVPLHPSPEHGYRMRARLHVQGPRIGFYREGTHELCDAGLTGQLLDGTVDVLQRLGARLEEEQVTSAVALELAENREATERVLLLDVRPDRKQAGRASAVAAPLEGCTGLAVLRAGRPLAATGEPSVTDVLAIASPGAAAPVPLRLRRHVSGFFQGNRHLLATLVERVVAAVPAGPVLDLYAGSGLFGLAAAAAGAAPVTCVESDPIAVEDLRDNAVPLGGAVRVRGEAVEAFLRANSQPPSATVLVDPPRTGMSREAAAAVAGSGAGRIVYISCDAATLARDARRLVQAGYRLAGVEVFDLFPNTAHLETLAVFERDGTDH